ncbi:GspH/FimT family pseudopilin [Dyella sp. Tek66A03]|uniref:GspH/FimT family pseudopilin n=1 Tax=Dyella sp. Tek66A03 TaxID=3458298 RepID=UPI00403E3899
MLAILASIAFPSMRDFMRRNQAVAVSNGLMADLQFARGQAAATRSYVSICPRANTTDDTCGTNATYDLGWVIYSASAPNVAYVTTSTATLQRAQPAVNGASVRASASGPITYNARGELLVGGGGDATFTTCAKVAPSDPEGANSSRVPGIKLSASHSGRVGSASLASGATCDD